MIPWWTPLAMLVGAIVGGAVACALLAWLLPRLDDFLDRHDWL